MVSFNKFFTSVFLAIVYASVTGATPWPEAAKHATHRTRNVGRGLKLEAYHPETTFKTFGEGLEQVSSFAATGIEDSAVSFVQSQLNIPATDIGYKSGYTTDTGKYAYVKQYHNGIPFANAVANVAWKGDKVVSFGSSFVKKSKIAPSKPSVDVKTVIPKAEKALDGKYNNHPSTLEYLARPDGSVALVHVVQIQNEEAGTWYEAFIDAHSGEVLTVTDFVSDASYTVLPITKETLPEGLETLTDPQDLLASPSGWHTVGSTSTTTTAGNNVVAYKSSQSSTTSQSSAVLNFNYSYSAASAPSATNNLNAARVNAFYIINTVHDFAYRYGFTETAFNFQSNNLGKGGSANDRVLISVQDSGGTNNANFATPPDGQSGTCRMYIWTYTLSLIHI
ncbi:Extracellular metalloproteinase 10 [Hypsizygus marmoreus]|uniref:Extracellular metalloproteinase n=1 Tax=Hypsizygus marmoreus TaxID=39966 RepID=A0A369JLF9_HYPMA|nr:Extracellular metalloproteinase 10 [Hypsizygus marmoreus]